MQESILEEIKAALQRAKEESQYKFTVKSPVTLTQLEHLIAQVEQLERDKEILNADWNRQAKFWNVEMLKMDSERRVLRERVEKAERWAKLWKTEAKDYRYRFKAWMNAAVDGGATNAKLRADLAQAERVIKCGVDFVAQVKDQKTSWPGEIDTFEERAHAFLVSRKQHSD